MDLLVHPPHLPRGHLVRGHGLPEQAGVQPPSRVGEPDTVSWPETVDEGKKFKNPKLPKLIESIKYLK